MPRKTTWIKLALLLLFFGIFLYFFYQYHRLFEAILELSAWELLLVSLLFLAGLSLNGFLFARIVARFGVKLPTKEWLPLAFVNHYSNYFIQKSGMAARGYYLKRIHGLAYAKFLAGSFFFLAAQIMVILVFWVLAMVYGRYWNWQTITFFCIIIILAGLFIYSRKPVTYLFGKISRLKPLAQAWLDLSMDKKFVLFVFSATTLLFLAAALRLFLLYKFLYEPIKFSEAIVINALGMAAFIAGITPASLGIREAMMALAGKMAGIELARAAVLGIADRIIMLFWALLIGIPASFWYAKKVIKHKFHDK